VATRLATALLTLLVSACLTHEPDGASDGAEETGAAEMGEALTPRCHPLYQATACEPPGSCGECAEGLGCYPYSGNTVFDCAPPGDRRFGESCTFSSECVAGALCIPAEVEPGCGNGSGCCTWFCDIEDESCPYATHCAPYFSGDAPIGYEDVGACVRAG
jgi:hypothetical protein